MGADPVRRQTPEVAPGVRSANTQRGWGRGGGESSEEGGEEKKEGRCGDEKE